ncbi:unnamed protein product [Meloidogyne enterolobii]|uniref:Uncharacterized protein n=1 Tax=Meloidogyne enterolobii TaxID=390850 RepID=A0ACB1AVN1_MELEN
MCHHPIEGYYDKHKPVKLIVMLHGMEDVLHLPILILHLLGVLLEVLASKQDCRESGVPDKWFGEEEEESWHQLVYSGTSTRLLVVPTVEGREGQ